MVRFQQHDPRRISRSTVDVRLTVDEAIVVMRAISAQQWREPDAEKRDDLESLRLKFYDRLSPKPAKVIAIDQCA